MLVLRWYCSGVLVLNQHAGLVHWGCAGDLRGAVEAPGHGPRGDTLACPPPFPRIGPWEQGRGVRQSPTVGRCHVPSPRSAEKPGKPREARQGGHSGVRTAGFEMLIPEVPKAKETSFISCHGTPRMPGEGDVPESLFVGQSRQAHPQNQKRLSFHAPRRVHRGLLDKLGVSASCETGGGNSGVSLRARGAVAATPR